MLAARRRAWRHGGSAADVRGQRRGWRMPVCYDNELVRTESGGMWYFHPPKRASVGIASGTADGACAAVLTCGGRGRFQHAAQIVNRLSQLPCANIAELLQYLPERREVATLYIEQVFYLPLG